MTADHAYSSPQNNTQARADVRRRTVTVAAVLEGRYMATAKSDPVEAWQSGTQSQLPSHHLVLTPYRPDSWDQRRSGTDIIRTTDGEVIRLASDGMQSLPKPGWKIVLLGDADGGGGQRWTLYGLPKTLKSAS